VELVNGVAGWLHRDYLGSVRAITDTAGAKVESAVYKPFGEQSEWLLPGVVAPETKGWIGERFDADAGLQYLNARYYDPALRLFLQPDWFEVTKAGVGTNRFSYSFNDPVNKFDPGGNDWVAPDGNAVNTDDDDIPGFSEFDPTENIDKVAIMAGITLAGPVSLLTGEGILVGLFSRFPATTTAAFDIGVTEATGMTVSVVGAAKAAPAALETIDDLLRAGIKVTGTPQVTRGAGGMSHAMASIKAGVDEVYSLGGAKVVDEVIFDTPLGKIVDGVSSRMKPDVAVRAKDGALSLVEAASPSQTVQEMLDKIDRMSRMIGTISPGISVSGWSRTVTDILKGQ
jgi:RHS repeat-associated protein